MRRLAPAVAVLITVGCGDSNEAEPSTDTATGSSSGDTDGTSASSDASTTDDTTGSTSSTTTTSTTTDDGTGSTSGDSNDTVEGPGGGMIDVQSSCNVDLGGTVVVSHPPNSPLRISSVYGNMLSGGFQLEAPDGVGTYMLSSMQRDETGTIVNINNTLTNWGNIDSGALTGGDDPISGTMTVNAWDPDNGISDVLFEDVVLFNMGEGSTCTINGTIETTMIFP